MRPALVLAHRKMVHFRCLHSRSWGKWIPISFLWFPLRHLPFHRYPQVLGTQICRDYCGSIVEAISLRLQWSIVRAFFRKLFLYSLAACWTTAVCTCWPLVTLFPYLWLLGQPLPTVYFSVFAESTSDWWRDPPLQGHITFVSPWFWQAASFLPSRWFQPPPGICPRNRQ